MFHIDEILLYYDKLIKVIGMSFDTRNEYIKCLIYDIEQMLLLHRCDNVEIKRISKHIEKLKTMDQIPVTVVNKCGTCGEKLVNKCCLCNKLVCTAKRNWEIKYKCDWHTTHKMCMFCGQYACNKCFNTLNNYLPPCRAIRHCWGPM